MRRTNRKGQLAVLLVLIFSLLLFSICLAVYVADDDSDMENRTQVSETAETEADENMTQVSGTEETAEAETENAEAVSETETTENMTRLSETEDVRAYFTAGEITEEIYGRINGCSYVENDEIALADLRYLNVLYAGFDGETHTGELIVNRAIAEDILEIMYELYQNGYPIERMVLVDEFDADDERSMQADNTSAFNYRTVEGSDSLSKHSYGLAIDINPFYNPCVRTYSDGSTQCFPAGSEPYADRSGDFAHKIDENDLCYQLFKAHGFSWGGDWNSLKDYQHFYKEINES